MAGPFRSLPLENRCQPYLLPPKSTSTPPLCLTFSICLFGYFLFPTLLCKLHEGRTLSCLLLLSPVPRTVPNTKYSVLNEWMNHLQIWKREEIQVVHEGFQRIVKSTCLKGEFWSMSHLSYLHNLITSILTFWTKNKAGTEKKAPIIPLIPLSNCCSQQPRSDFLLLFSFSLTSNLLTLIQKLYSELS